MVLCFSLCMNGLVFQRVREWSCVSECERMVLCLRLCMNGLVFKSVCEWSCV